MKSSPKSKFDSYYGLHCKHLKLKGLRPKTIDAYARAIRRISEYFDYRIDDLTETKNTDISAHIKPIITPILSHTTAPILTKTLNKIDYLYEVTRDVIAYYALTVNKSSFEEKLRENLLCQIQSVEFTSASYEDACKRILNVFKNTIFISGCCSIS